MLLSHIHERNLSIKQSDLPRVIPYKLRLTYEFERLNVNASRNYSSTWNYTLHDRNLPEEAPNW